MDSVKDTELDPLALAQVCRTSELKRESFPCWIGKSIPVRCGPGLINNDQVFILRTPHLSVTDSFGMTPKYKSLT
jgi:hypothetical protein